MHGWFETCVAGPLAGDLNPIACMIDFAGRQQTRVDAALDCGTVLDTLHQRLKTRHLDYHADQQGSSLTELVRAEIFCTSVYRKSISHLLISV